MEAEKEAEVVQSHTHSPPLRLQMLIGLRLGPFSLDQT